MDLTSDQHQLHDGNSQINWRFGESSMKSFTSQWKKAATSFMAWSEDARDGRGREQTVEFRRCVAEIKQDIQYYRSIVKKFPKAAEFTDRKRGPTGPITIPTKRSGQERERSRYRD